MKKIFLVVSIFFSACKERQEKIYIKSVLPDSNQRIDWYFFSAVSNFSRSYLQLHESTGDKTFFESFYLSDMKVSNDTLTIQVYRNDYKLDIDKIKRFRIIIDTSGGIWNQASSRLGRLQRKNVDFNSPHFQDSFCPKNECY